jgi:hypothetical protein
MSEMVAGSLVSRYVKVSPSRTIRKKSMSAFLTPIYNPLFLKHLQTTGYKWGLKIIPVTIRVNEWENMT